MSPGQQSTSKANLSYILPHPISRNDVSEVWATSKWTWSPNFATVSTSKLSIYSTYYVRETELCTHR